MSNNLFIKYNQLARKAEVQRGTKESLEWFNRTVRKQSKIRNINEVTDGFERPKFRPGEMLVYTYNPKLKDTLAYYDENPLIVFLERTTDGWYGINLHYLPPRMRADLLFDIQYNSKKLPQIVKALEKNPMTKPCLKRYLAKQLTTKPVGIPKDQWEIAIQLPFESFVKAAQRDVWRLSKSKI
jgi:hypothetical protein